MPKAATTARPRANAKPRTNATQAEPEVDLESMFVDIDDTIDFVNALFWGREGSTKTTAAATAANAIPGKGRILVINAEGGLKKGPLGRRGIDLSRIVVFPDPKKHERISHKRLDAIHRKIKADLEADPESWFAIVIDSATEVHTAVLDHVQLKRVTAIQNRGQDVDEDFVDRSDYGTMSKLFRDILRKFRDLPCHFIVTALERRDVDEDTGKPQYGPAVTPGLQSDLLGYVDFVMFFKAPDEEGPARALTKESSRYRVKDRFDVLPRVLAEPTFERVLLYLSGELDEENDPVQKSLPVKAKKAQDATKPVDDEDEESEDADEENTE